MTGFQTGLQALQQAIDDGKRNAAGFTGGSLNYFSWKDGDKKILRFLSDVEDVITGDIHEFIVCNDGKTRGFLINPEHGDLVAKYASPTPGVGWKQNFKTKALEERKPRKISVGLAVLRNEVPHPSGKGVTYEDALDDVEVNGERFRGRWFGVIQQSHGNFWSMVAGYANRNGGTLLDRDYEIIRKGTGFDTEYQIYACDPIDELRDPAVVKQFYGYGRPWNDEDPDRFLFCPQTLAQWAEYFSGEERIKHWLLPTNGDSNGTAVAPASVASSGLGEFHKDTTHNADEAQATPPPVAAAASANTDFASLREKLMPHASASKK